MRTSPQRHCPRPSTRGEQTGWETAVRAAALARVRRRSKQRHLEPLNWDMKIYTYPHTIDHGERYPNLTMYHKGVMRELPVVVSRSRS